MNKRILFLLIYCWSIVNLSGQELPFKQGEVLVQLQQGLAVADFVNVVEEYQGKPTDFGVKSKISSPANIWHFSFNDELIDSYEFLIFLKSHPLVLAAQFNHWVELRNVPDDYYYNLQWYFNNPDTQGIDIDAETAWAITTGGITAEGDTIVIAVIDDGVDINHPDLAQNLWINHAEIPNNEIDDDNNGYIDDYQGWNVPAASDNQGIGTHGTGVMGIAAAVGNNNQGITGLNWQIKTMSIVIGNNTEAEVIAAYSYALEQRQLYQQSSGNQGAFVVATNTSFGIDEGNPEDAPLWCDFFNLLGENGILNVAATTNNEVNVDQIGDIPTTCNSPYLISVTATDQFDQRNFAGYGVEHIDLASPGELILTLDQNADVSFKTGTSYAAPLVTGLVGLTYALPCGHLSSIALNDPVVATELVRDFIFAGVEQVDNLQDETKSGGRINAYETLNLAEGLCENCSPPIISSTAGNSESSIEISFLNFESDSVDLVWKASDDLSSSWEIIENISSPYSLQDLEICTDYQFYLISHCGTEEAISNVKEEQTLGCCTPPTDAEWTTANVSDIVIFWTPLPNSEGYVFRYASAGGEWQEGNEIINPPLIFEDLLYCVQAEFQIAPICNGEIGEYSESITVQSGGCGVCLDGNYCNSTGFSTLGEYIDKIQFSYTVNESGDDSGYGDFTQSESIYLVEGMLVSFILTPGYPLLSYQEHWSIWVDFNKNELFEEEELMFSEIAEGELIGSFTVPPNTGGGSTRMRISMQFSDTFTSPDPCENIPFGEVEDYCVELGIIEPGGGGAFCYAPEQLSVEAVDTHSVHLAWEEVIGATYFKLNLLSNSGAINIYESSSNEIELNSLQACTSYSLTIQSFCAIGEGEVSPTFDFTTNCPTSLNLIEPNISSVLISPNPFNDFLGIELIDSPAELKVELINSNGQKILSKTLRSTNNRFQLDNLFQLSTGIYFLKSEYEDKTFVQKVIKM